MSVARIDVRDLSVRAGGRPVLDSISFAVDGEVLGIAGSNGSGKSTLIRAIAAAARKRTDAVRLSGTRADAAPRVGHLPQAFGLPRTLTVQECVEYAAWIRGASDVAASASRAVRLTRLTEHRHRKIAHASGGVVQRTGFASVLVDAPDILLLDEPTTGVDIRQREVMREIISRESRGRATIVSSHIVEDLEKLCDRVLVLRGGRAAFLGTMADARSATGESSSEGALLALTRGRE